MIFSNPIQTIPRATDPVLGADAVAPLHHDLTPKAAQALTGIAGSSPFLRGLILDQSPWLHSQLNADPQSILSDIQTFVRTGSPPLDDRLRIAKKRCALFLAICDLCGISTMAEITKSLTIFADTCVDTACKFHIQAARTAGKLDPQIIDQNPHGGLIVLAMGKMGAHELNYSSDIDLIFLLNDDLYAPQDVPEARAAFVKITQAVHKSLTAQTAHGYVFRTDLRLRPNPSITPVCPTQSAALRYYETEGRTWERSAFIKARPCAADLQSGAEFMEKMQPFVWRQNLDFAALSEINDLLITARTHKGVNTAITVAGHDMKMGRGGIREIEFFAQTQQLTFGGRDESLRDISTVRALQSLATAGHISADTANQLTHTYTQHRDTEHRIQMIRDAQTHTMPTTLDAMKQLANLCAYDDVKTYQSDIQTALERTHSLTKTTTSRAADRPVPTPKGNADIPDQWADLRILRNERTKELFTRLRPAIHAIAQQSSEPDIMLDHFAYFLRQLTASVQLFSLFDLRPKTLETVMTLCALSKPLADDLAHHDHLLEGLIGGADSTYSLAGFTDLLNKAVSDPSDYELSLNQIRRAQNEAHFGIRVAQLQGNVDQHKSEAAYTDLAQACLEICITLVTREMQRRYGTIPNTRLGILAMGKLGSCEMTATSDLDIILIFDGDQTAQSTGVRSLDTRSYYAKLTRMLIAAVSTQMAEGRLYEVDMRLRPSGRSGPVATSLDAFDTYQNTRAWVWEHLALSRARTICATPPLGPAIEAVRKHVLTDVTFKGTPWPDVAEMVDKLRSTAPTADATLNWPVKKAPGGILEIELIAQAFTLSNIGHARSPKDQLIDAVMSGQLPNADGDRLIDTLEFLTRIEHLKRVLLTVQFRSTDLSPAAGALFCQQTGAVCIDDISAQIQTKLEASRALIDQILAKYVKV